MTGTLRSTADLSTRRMQRLLNKKVRTIFDSLRQNVWKIATATDKHKQRSYRANLFDIHVDNFDIFQWFIMLVDFDILDSVDGLETG